MREIKFRAWDGTRDEPRYITWEQMMVGFTVSTAFINVRNVTLEQYTGLKDKNGKDIYEGDILQVYGSEWGDNDGIYHVEFSPSYFAIIRNRDGMIRSMARDINECFEVIGNIHETQELLDA